MFIAPVSAAPSFGTKGTSRNDLCKRAALHDIAFCLSESRVYSNTLYTKMNWLELADEAANAARRYFATEQEIAAARGRVI